MSLIIPFGLLELDSVFISRIFQIYYFISETILICFIFLDFKLFFLLEIGFSRQFKNLINLNKTINLLFTSTIYSFFYKTSMFFYIIVVLLTYQYHKPIAIKDYCRCSSHPCHRSYEGDFFFLSVSRMQVNVILI